MRLLISIKCKSLSKRDYMASKTRSLGQFLAKACVHIRHLSVDMIFIKMFRLLVSLKIQVNLKTTTKKKTKKKKQTNKHVNMLRGHMLCWCDIHNTGSKRISQKYRSSLKLGHMGSIARSAGQTFEKHKPLCAC